MHSNYNQPRSIAPVFSWFTGRIFWVMILSFAATICSIGICAKVTMEAGWTKTKAEVVKTFIDHVNVKSDVGALNVVYQYTYKGAPYTVTELIHDDKLSDLKMEQQTYQKRRTINVCVNPYNPTEARIDDTNLVKMIAMFMGCALVTGLGFATSAAILFRPVPSDSVVAPIRRNKVNKGHI